MNIILVGFLIVAIIVVGIRYSRNKRTAKELLLENILTTLSKKFSRADVTIEGHVTGALVRKMHVEGTGATMTYEWPVEENVLELPRVLSGTLNDAVEWNGNEFSSLQFVITHEKECGGRKREYLGYQITLYKKDSGTFRMEGIIGKNTLATSTHLSSFDRIVLRVGGA